MHPLAEIADRIEERVASSHEDVVTRALSYFDRALDEAEQMYTECSYRAALHLYVRNKIKAHHIRRLEDQYFGIFLDRTEYERRARALHANMYDNVCGYCSACKTRRKAWPQSTTWHPGRKIELPPVKCTRKYFLDFETGTMGIRNIDTETRPLEPYVTYIKRLAANDIDDVITRQLQKKKDAILAYCEQDAENFG